ncbi:Trm112 family protein [OM182 bacterium]|jgi:hypothetical protein|nr:Trm112 family protein [OM182 bacterium]
MSFVEEKLLSLLSCPLCKGELIYERKNARLVCSKGLLFYPINDGIPVLLVDRAVPLTEDESKDFL